MPLVTHRPDDWLSERRRADAADTGTQVAEVLADVRRRGDLAVREWTRRWDGVDLDDYRVEASDVRQAWAALDSDLRGVLEFAADRIRAFAETTRPPRAVSAPPADGIQARVIWEPLRRVAVYVPAGRWPLCSSVLMGGIPARVAEVGDVVLFTPPQRDGRPDPTTLAAAGLLGIEEVYLVGGAQAIAVAAFGTETVRAVEAVVGPGNRFVTEAKRQVQGMVRIDGLNGPSEVVIWGEPPAPVDQVALDLLAQAEHDPASWALVVSRDEEWLRHVGRAVDEAGGDSLARQAGVGAVVVSGPDEAVRFINAFGPEHLELWGSPVQHRSRLTVAGATFLDCPTPLGDYVAGPNHVLPTGGRARFGSVLGVEDFLRRRTETRVVGDMRRAAAAGARLARAEGLSRHAAALDRFGEEAPS